MTKTLIVFIVVILVCTAGVYPQDNTDTGDEGLNCGWFCQLDRWLEKTDSEIQGYVETGVN